MDLKPISPSLLVPDSDVTVGSAYSLSAELRIKDIWLPLETLSSIYPIEVRRKIAYALMSPGISENCSHTLNSYFNNMGRVSYESLNYALEAYRFNRKIERLRRVKSYHTYISS